MVWVIFVAGAVLSWGAYGALLHLGQTQLGNPLKALLCVGVARPQMSLKVPSERATVVLALDVSGSMRAKDVAPTRLDAARTAVERFLDKLPKQVRVGLILFSSEPYVAVPPTHDRDEVLSGLELALPQFGTAIGDSVSRAAELAKSAGVGQYVLFHHDPSRSDAKVAEIEAKAQALFPSSVAAREGMRIALRAQPMAIAA